jgi:large subunit ribosomal protein L9
LRILYPRPRLDKGTGREYRSGFVFPVINSAGSPFYFTLLITMATTEVILREKLENLGAEADIVSVRRGFARNYLIPGGKAFEATSANRRHIERLKESRARREAEEFQEAEKKATKLRKIKLTLELATGQGGKAFGSVTLNDVLEGIKSRTKLDIDRRQVEFKGPIKATGAYEVPVKLHPDVIVNIPLKVKAKEDEANAASDGGRDSRSRD